MEESDVKSTCGGLRYIVQYMTRCKIFVLKFDKTKELWFGIWQGEKNSIENHAFQKKFSFKIVLSKSAQKAKLVHFTE